MSPHSFLINRRPVFLTLIGSDQRRFSLPIDTDVHRWYPFAPGSSSALQHTVSLTDTPLPSGVTPGRYQLGLWLPDAAESLRDIPEYAIRLANDVVYRDGVNVLGEITVKDKETRAKLHGK